MHLQVFKYTSEYSANGIPESNMHSIFVVVFRISLAPSSVPPHSRECDLFFLATSLSDLRKRFLLYLLASLHLTLKLGVIKPFNTYSYSLTARLLTAHPNQNLGSVQILTNHMSLILFPREHTSHL